MGRHLGIGVPFYFVTSLLLQHFFHQFALQTEHVGGGDAGFEDLADEGVRGRGRVVDEDDEVAVGAAGELQFFGGVSALTGGQTLSAQQ